MQVRMLQAADELQRYDSWIRSHPESSLWQSSEWKSFQEARGRETRIYVQKEREQIVASALVVIDTTSFGLSTWDIPRGPLAASSQQYATSDLLQHIIEEARKEKCVSLFHSPQAPCALRTAFCVLHTSPRHEQPSATRLINLAQSEEAILRQMKPKGRYNISIAEKHGVRVERSTDAATLHRLLKQTSRRDRFAIHPEKHYKAFLEHLPGAFLLFATLPPNTKSIAALLGVIWESKAYYYYGASDHTHRALMAPYALQWAAMRHCKAAGCASYDLLGIAPPDAAPDHPWKGVSSFKEKFGGTVVTYPTEQEIVLRPVTHALLKMKRKLVG